MFRDAQLENCLWLLQANRQKALEKRKAKAEARIDAEIAAEKAGIKSTDYRAVELQMASLQSVKDLTKDLKGSLGQRGLDRLVCNAVRLPTAAPPPRHQAAATRPPPTRPYSSLARVGGVPADRPQAPLH